MKRIVLSVTNDLVTDQRVHRVAATLMKHGAQVTLVGRLLHNSLPIHREYATHRMRLLFKRSWLFYAEYNIRLFCYLFIKKSEILVSNDLDTLPANYLVSKMRRKTLVFDAHELFTEVPELIDRKLIKSIWQTLERRILPGIKHAYTVSQSVADTYFKRYGTKIEVVRNLPVKWNDVDRNNPYPGLPASDFVLYQGAINKGRGLEALVDAFAYIHEIKCVIAGDGDIQQSLKERIDSKNLQDKIILLGKLPFSDLKRVTPYAVLGLSIEENMGLNYYNALPNKVFDYIQAKVPVLVSNFPEMRRIVTSFEVGEILVSHEPKELATQLEQMVHKSKNGLWQTNLSKAAQELCWEMEETALMKIYNPLLENK